MKKADVVGRKLLEMKKISPFSSSSWRDDVPNKPGVYVIWTKKGAKTAQYVGETTSLLERFKDLGSWRNHTFSRKVKNKYDLDTPTSIRSKISEFYEISYCAVDFGRKEVEESLIYKWKTHKKFNKASPRYENSRSNA
jgi:hypothetical protein